METANPFTWITQGSNGAWHCRQGWNEVCGLGVPGPNIMALLGAAPPSGDVLNLAIDIPAGTYPLPGGGSLTIGAVSVGVYDVAVSPHAGGTNILTTTSAIPVGTITLPFGAGTFVLGTPIAAGAWDLTLTPHGVNPPPPPPPPPPSQTLFRLTFRRAFPVGSRVPAFIAPVNIPAGTYDVSPSTKVHDAAEAILTE